jgi:hypothetical protein
VKIGFASKVFVFQKTLQYVVSINLSYSRQTTKLQSKVLLGSTWVITKAVIDILGLVVEQCILN